MLIFERKSCMPRFRTSDKIHFFQLLKTWRPIRFQGGSKKSNYFEGWYFKLVSQDGKHIWSTIPGISIIAGGKSHAFIQLIDGKTAETWYSTFPISDFRYSQKTFRVEIDRNVFSYQGLKLDINDRQNNLIVRGQISFSDTHPMKTTLLNPGIMGWYSFMPFMECYHGLVSMNHSLEGTLVINGAKQEFSGGKGYAEKDWGRSMPESWIWMQSNHFQNDGVSFMLSIAKIPWLGSSFTGFLCVLLLDGRIHRFATYTGAKLVKINLDHEHLTAEIRDKKMNLQITARHAQRGMLAAPLHGAMDRRIAESVDAIIHLKVTNTRSQTVFSGRGIHAGLELVGDMKELPV